MPAQTPRAIEALVAKLADAGEHSMVRHEAAEALGAIATPECMPVLERYAGDSCREVAETCQLAVQRIAYWREQRSAGSPAAAAAPSKGSRKETFALPPAGAAAPCGDSADAEASDSAFLSGASCCALARAALAHAAPACCVIVDPVPAAPASTPLPELRATVLDEGAPMFERYRALFALRNRGGTAVAPLLAEVLERSGSALLKHEICYVMGQLQEADTVAALERTLADCTQHAMVRHEAAEALGSIAGPSCAAQLQRYVADADAVVAEGCLVALDILEYETSGAFEYCALE
jgi:deoxyhypusine monooxygenase